MSGSEILASWQTRTCVLATMHHKEAVIAPLFAQELNVSVSVPEQFDTDRFGTFTREIARAGDQLEAARAKARAALSETGADLALSSEGSFGTHPSMPWVPSNLELVVLIDALHDLEIVGHYRSMDAPVRSQEVRTPDEAVTVARSWGFPEQGVIVRRSSTSSRDIHKEVRTVDELERISAELLGRWLQSSICIETDMRAHRCPARMTSIQRATLDLITHCKSHCPSCTRPGFKASGVAATLPCAGCGLPTDIPAQLTYTCTTCAYHEVRPVGSGGRADPGTCARCNP